jgi:hypothetical protein
MNIKDTVKLIAFFSILLGIIVGYIIKGTLG